MALSNVVGKALFVWSRCAPFFLLFVRYLRSVITAYSAHFLLSFFLIPSQGFGAILRPPVI